jgi:hypothetical protein
MKSGKYFISLLLTAVLIFTQATVVFAAPNLGKADFLSGTVQEISLQADAATGLTTVVVKLVNINGDTQTARIGLETALNLGLITLDGDGKPLINEAALGTDIEIDPTTILKEDKQHPVGLALSTFFSDIQGLDYSSVMDAHSQGNGFGVIAQVLWLTRKLGGDASVFEAILQAKKDGDFSSFTFEDGSSPTSWGQFRNAVLGEDKKGNLGIVMSNRDQDENGNNGNGNSDKTKDKTNNGHQNGNGHSNGHQP